MLSFPPFRLDLDAERLWRGDEELREATLKTLATVRAHLATLLIAGATLVAGSVLAIVALHVLTD